jgi:hypothetical protein
MNLKDLAGRVRLMVGGTEGSPETSGPQPALQWEALGMESATARPAQATPAERGPSSTPPAQSKPEARGPIADRGPWRPGPDGVDAAGRALRWKSAATVPDLATIYKEAAIEPPLHGYGVDKIDQMLNSPRLASSTREVRSIAALVALEAARVPLRDLMDDAVLRSKALAAFEADKAFELHMIQTRAERRAQALRDQVESFRRQKKAEIEELQRRVSAAEQSLAQLRVRRRREEDRLHRLVTHFVEPRPAVMASPAPAPQVRPIAEPPAPTKPVPGPMASPRPAAEAPPKAASEPQFKPAAEPPARPALEPPGKPATEPAPKSGALPPAAAKPLTAPPAPAKPEAAPAIAPTPSTTVSAARSGAGLATVTAELASPKDAKDPKEAKETRDTPGGRPASAAPKASDAGKVAEAAAPASPKTVTVSERRP